MVRGRGITVIVLLVAVLAAGGAGTAARVVQDPARPAEPSVATADRDGNGVFDDLDARLARMRTADTVDVLVATSAALSPTEVAGFSQRVGGFSAVRRFG